MAFENGRSFLVALTAPRYNLRHAIDVVVRHHIHD